MAYTALLPGAMGAAWPRGGWHGEQQRTIAPSACCFATAATPSSACAPATTSSRRAQRDGRCAALASPQPPVLGPEGSHQLCSASSGTSTGQRRRRRMWHRTSAVLSPGGAGNAAPNAAEEQEEPEEALARRHSNNAGLTQAELESLDVLEWPAVARLCGTVMGAVRLAQGGVPLGRSLEHSQLLLQQTLEARELGLRVDGVYDLTPALDVVEAGGCLNAKQLEGVAASLQAALQLKASVEAPGDGGALRYPALAALAQGMDPEEARTVAAIRHCIRLGGVSDEASEALAEVRARRRDNSEELRRLMDGLARQLYEKGASDSRSVTLIRERYSVGIKAGRQSDLPKGSVKLGASQTGATMYYEPAPAIPLNNAAALLAAKEAQEEAKVLTLLSQLVASRAAAVRELLESVTRLDVVAARAAHGVRFGGVAPELVPARHAAGATASAGPGRAPGPLLHVPWAHHPLLLERALPEPLPEPPSLDDHRFDRNFAPPPAWEPRRSSVGPPTSSPPSPEDTASSAAATALEPKPLDLRVPAVGGADASSSAGTPVRVVAITGPNTGGKTVALKTLGLMALMARAGMHLPVRDGGGGGGGGGGARVVVGWFSRVLADIGDAQSLQQSLSTFSGHIRRIKQVLSAVDGGSLVLLDEVGSGTDPLEGAALARAILDRLAGAAALTAATTHHAELKQASAEDARYTNVSMEFDTASLRPTYRLLWGTVGASNALQIARTLGFDSGVLDEAEGVARSTFEQEKDRAARLAATAASLVKQLEDAQAELEDAKGRRAALERQLQALRARAAELNQTNNQLMASPRLIIKRRDKIRASLQDAVAAYEAGRGARSDVDAILEELEGQIADKVAQHNSRGIVSGAAKAGAPSAVAKASAGDRVVVPSRFGEATTFIVESVSGGVATLLPDGSLGAGLHLLTLGGTSKRGRAGTTRLKVPLGDCAVLTRGPAAAAGAGP